MLGIPLGKFFGRMALYFPMEINMQQFALNRVSNLSILSPETIIAINDASLSDQLKALPKVELVGPSISTVYYLNDDGSQSRHVLTIESALPQKIETVMQVVVTDSHVIVAGTSYDDSAENPITDCDGNGAIYHRGRRAASDVERRDFNKVYGLDQHGEKDVGLSVVVAEWIRGASDAIRSKRNLISALCNVLRKKKGRATWNSVLLEVANAINRGGPGFALSKFCYEIFDESVPHKVHARYQHLVEELEQILSVEAAEEAWNRLAMKGEVGEKYAVPLDIYEHGMLAYRLAGTGVRDQFDTTSNGAVWVPDAEAMSNIMAAATYKLGDSITEEAIEKAVVAYAKPLIEDYENFVNGQSYGVLAYAIDRRTGEVTHQEAEWGLIGTESAEEICQQTLLELTFELIKSVH